MQYGFGEAIASMPLLALLSVPLQTSVSLIVTSALGIFLIIFGCYSLLKKLLSRKIGRPLLNNRGWDLPFGFASGVLGSAYNFNGNPAKRF
ncbi:hypothetical protein [Paenibacillus chitinolyticus]